MKIWMSRYALRSRHAASAGGRGTRQGVLLRVETSAWTGYADLHPWPELGDEPLETQLESLRAGTPARLAARSLGWAEIDGTARAENKSVFDGLEIPPSHFLIDDLSFAGKEMVGALEDDGFRIAKFKVGRDPRGEIEVLSRLAEDTESAVRLRLDFNAKLDAAGVRAFVAALPPMIRGRIEFIEDPCSFDARAWKSLRPATAPLALDRGPLGPAELGPAKFRAAAESGAVDVLVVKPATDDVHEIVSSFVAASTKETYCVVTSYLDHPLGQAAAAFAAAALKKAMPERIGTCGLLSHLAYEPNEFSESLGLRGPILLAPDGKGFGFDELLRRLEWRDLKT